MTDRESNENTNYKIYKIIKLFIDLFFWEIPYPGFTNIFTLLHEICTELTKEILVAFFSLSFKVFLGSWQRTFEITQRKVILGTKDTASKEVSQTSFQKTTFQK